MVDNFSLLYRPGRPSFAVSEIACGYSSFKIIRIVKTLLSLITNRFHKQRGVKNKTINVTLNVSSYNNNRYGDIITPASLNSKAMSHYSKKINNRVCVFFISW